MLTAFGAALLKSRGYDFKGTEPVNEREFRAIATKGQFRAEALGAGRDDATRRLLAVIARP